MPEIVEVKEKLTENTLFEKLINIFNEVCELEHDIKDLVDQAKEDEVEDVSLIKIIAKAKAYNKIGDLEDKAKAQLQKIQDLTN